MTVNAAAVAKHHGVKAFINMSQMTLSQMSITETTASPQQKLHWLAEQALNWSGLPVVHVRPTVLLEGFFLILTPDSVRESNQIRLRFGEGSSTALPKTRVRLSTRAIRNRSEQVFGGISTSNTAGSLPDLAITKTIDEVIVYHSDGLHVGINDRRTNETESAMLEVPAECIGFG